MLKLLAVEVLPEEEEEEEKKKNKKKKKEIRRKQYLAAESGKLKTKKRWTLLHRTI